MGVYYTCDICGETEKGFFPCDCHLEMAQTTLQSLVGKTILSVHIVRDQMSNAMVFKVQDGAEVLYFFVKTGGCPDEGDYNRAEANWIDEQEFDDFTQESLVIEVEEEIAAPESSNAVKSFTFDLLATHTSKDKPRCQGHVVKTGAQCDAPPKASLVTLVEGKKGIFRTCIVGIGPGTSCPDETLPNCDYCAAHARGLDESPHGKIARHKEQTRLEKLFEERFGEAAKESKFWNKFCFELKERSSIDFDINVSEMLESWRWCELGGKPLMQNTVNVEYAVKLREFEIDFLFQHAQDIPARLVGADFCSAAASEIVNKADDSCFGDFLRLVGVNTNIN